MSELTPSKLQILAKPVAVAAALFFVYYSVITKLGYDWWIDENYSHGLLIPFVIAFILWNERETLKERSTGGAVMMGSAIMFAALAMLTVGTLGSELFTQRISLVVMLVGIAVYFGGKRILSIITLPAVLLVLAIPIPQILFNRIAFPLQLWASKMAVWGIRLFEVPTLRKGNVIDILPRGSSQSISLEVVEACSGIRSLMTLVTLALVLAYFTRGGGRKVFAAFSKADLTRALLLMAAAVPIAVLTNAARVTATGVLTFYYGKQATESTWHDVSGWVVYVVALALLIGANYLFKMVFREGDPSIDDGKFSTLSLGQKAPAVPLIAALLLSGLAVNWFVNRTEQPVERQMLTAFPKQLGEWQQKADEIRFDEQVESVLRTTDYTMREYSSADGRVANIYVGYYASQRTGATYHSPRNCLPGAGWIMSSPEMIDITTSDGKTFTANRYIIENGAYKEVMIYWYQGRGRSEANEYADKLNTIWDSVTRRRTDGAMIRVMTTLGSDEPAAIRAASDLSARVEENIEDFVPD